MRQKVVPTRPRNLPVAVSIFTVSPADMYSGTWMTSPVSVVADLPRFVALCPLMAESHSTSFQVTQHHDAAQVTYMQTVRRRVNAYVGDGHLFHQLLLRAGHNIMQHPAPTEFFYKILHRLSSIFEKACKFTKKF